MALALGVWSGAGPLFGANPSPEQIEFFEKSVRPIFAEHCYNCHSDKARKVKGGLKLDTAEALVKGGTSGAAIVPGDPETSLLIKAVRYSDPDLQMPPKNKKLSSQQIALLETWVKMGAPLPHASIPVHPIDRINEVRASHWAFQPVKKPPVPAVKNKRWPQTPVDNFILAAIEKNNLLPSPAADRRSLIRRVTYDLTGLPPTAQAVEDFLHDKRADAYPRLVEDLLASPHYGERWGRYWLDVARYADTRGYLAGGEERRYPFSYTYRDYVIRALNEDKPYNQFLIEQIAADKLSHGEDKRDLAALGFLTLGRRFLNNQNDIIDDRIDVVTRGTLGLTVACARCHDHKFDPISSKDYYALHGIFASSEEPAEQPLLGPLTETPAYQEFLKEKARIETEIVEMKDREIAKFSDEIRKHVGDYLLGARAAAGLTNDAQIETVAGEHKVNLVVLKRWAKDLDTRAQTNDPVFKLWFSLAALPETNFQARVKTVLDSSGNRGVSNPVVRDTLANATNVISLKAAADVYSKVFGDIDIEWKAAVASASTNKPAAPSALTNPAHEALRQVLYGENSPVDLSRSEVEGILHRQLREGSAPLRNKIQGLSWTHPGAPPRAMAIFDKQTPENPHVFLRGNPGNLGEEVPRRFIEVLSPRGAAPFTNGSGRLEFARAIASPDNPLTARVFVNRIWLHHFGEGFVSTGGDFGVRTEEPLHRPLLDYLAARFVEDGWSIKKLHRLIVLSAAYQQSSDPRPGNVKTDPDNRLFSWARRERLDFEALRDTLLAVGGSLDAKLAGLSVDLQAEPFSPRRSIYGYIDRQNLPGVLRSFDFANPDTSNQGRFQTTVPQQALFLMNSPFVIQQAKGLAQRPEIKSARSEEARLAALYRVVFQRSPDSNELRLGKAFISSQAGVKPDPSLSALEKYAQVLLLSNELMFVD
jgi:hypothetical protein